MNDERKLQFGYPEFWQEAVHENRGFYAIAPRLLATINGVTCREYSSLLVDQSLILNLAMLAGLGATEIITLVGNGMGQGAMKIVRNILRDRHKRGVYPEASRAGAVLSGLALGGNAQVS